MYSLNSYIFFPIVVLFTTVIGLFIDKYKQKNKKVFICGFIAIFIILWFILTVSRCGADYKAYKMFFYRGTELEFLLKQHNLEPGFALFNFIISSFTSYYVNYSAIISAVFLFFIFGSIYNLKNKINVGMAILAFTSTFYFQAMNLRRIYLACSIVLFAITLLLKNKNKISLVLLIIASTIHYSAVIGLLIYLITRFNTKKISTKNMILLSVVLIIGFYFFRYFLLDLIKNIDRYEHYFISENPIGFMQLIYNVPLIIVFGIMREREHDNLTEYCFIMSLLSLVFGYTGYFVTIAGRTFVYFILPFLVVPAFAAKIFDNYNEKKVRRVVNFVFIIYFFFRLYIYMSGLMHLDDLATYVYLLFI